MHGDTQALTMASRTAPLPVLRPARAASARAERSTDRGAAGDNTVRARMRTRDASRARRRIRALPLFAVLAKHHLQGGADGRGGGRKGESQRDGGRKGGKKGGGEGMGEVQRGGPGRDRRREREGGRAREGGRDGGQGSRRAGEAVSVKPTRGGRQAARRGGMQVARRGGRQAATGGAGSEEGKRGRRQRASRQRANSGRGRWLCLLRRTRKSVR